jgi:hypothetical protein
VELKKSLLLQLEPRCKKNRIFDSDNVLCIKTLELMAAIIFSFENKDLQKVSEIFSSRVFSFATAPLFNF